MKSKRYLSDKYLNALNRNLANDVIYFSVKELSKGSVWRSVNFTLNCSVENSLKDLIKSLVWELVNKFIWKSLRKSKCI